MASLVFRGIFPLILLLAVPAAQAFDLTLEAEGLWRPQADSGAQGSLAGLVELRPYARDDGITRTLDLSLFGRQDQDNSERSHADVRELLFTVASRDFELRAGAGRVFWGVTEGNHVVDIINQDDLLEDLDGEDKLGQPMLSLAWTGRYGIWRGYLLPRFRALDYPQDNGFEAPFPIAEDQARFESSQARQHVDYALRTKQLFGPVDLALSYFNGTGREPRIRPCAGQGTGRPGTENGPNCDLDEAFMPPDASPLELFLVDLAATAGLGPSQDELEDEFIEAAMADIVLVPHYDQIEQWGLELQAILGGWALKFEGRHRLQAGADSQAAVAGFEYTQGDAFGSGADLGYLAEYLYDSRGAGASLSLFDNDLLIGGRVFLNDVAGSQLLAGVIVDLDGRGQLFSAEYSRRLGEAWKLALETRMISGIPGDDPLAFLADADSLRVQLFRYF